MTKKSDPYGHAIFVIIHQMTTNMPLTSPSGFGYVYTCYCDNPSLEVSNLDRAVDECQTNDACAALFAYDCNVFKIHACERPNFVCTSAQNAACVLEKLPPNQLAMTSYLHAIALTLLVIGFIFFCIGEYLKGKQEQYYEDRLLSVRHQSLVNAFSRRRLSQPCPTPLHVLPSTNTRRTRTANGFLREKILPINSSHANDGIVSFDQPTRESVHAPPAQHAPGTSTAIITAIDDTPLDDDTNASIPSQMRDISKPPVAILADAISTLKGTNDKVYIPTTQMISLPPSVFIDKGATSNPPTLTVPSVPTNATDIDESNISSKGTTRQATHIEKETSTKHYAIPMRSAMMPTEDTRIHSKVNETMPDTFVPPRTRFSSDLKNDAQRNNTSGHKVYVSNANTPDETNNILKSMSNI